MKKIFIAFSFILLFAVKTFGQVAVDIPLIAITNGNVFPLSIGLDLTATNCIDSQLGESDLPSPQPGWAEIRFDLYPYGCGPVSTYKDYRAPGNPPVFPFTGMIEHTFWMMSVDGMPVDITYYLPTGVSMTIVDNITGTLLNLGPFTGQGVATIPGSYTAFATKALFKMEYDNIVPVELTSFTASVLQNEKAVQLNWSTATETNNSGFEVHRKKLEARSQKSDWENIGFVPGFGTTTEPKSYSFSDENITTGIYKYRLKQIDFDGSFTYSDEIEVEVDFTPNEFVLYQNYPNPFNPSSTIKFEIPNVETTRRVVFTTLKVYDILGNEIATLVNEEKQPGVYEVEFNSSSLASGMYLYKLQAGTFVQIKKMILAK